jgi:hypothetical protein
MSLRMLTASWLAVVLIGLLGFKLVHDTDIFWQVKLGQIMLEEGQIQLGDRLTYTHAGEPAPPIGWLAQVLLALLYKLGGWYLARAVHHVALVGSLLVAAATCQRDRTSRFSALVAMTIGFAVMLSNADLRPQSYGLLGFAFLLALARGRWPFWFKLLAASTILVVWQNLHPSVVVATFALGALAAADFVDRNRDHARPWEQVILALLAMASQFATPLGSRILDISRDNLRISRDVLHNPEWLPPWDPAVAPDAVRVYWIALFCSLIAIVWFWRHVSYRDRALFVVMTLLSLYASRFIILWAVALVPLWAELAERLVPRGMFVWARGLEDQAVRGVRSWIVLAGVLLIVISLHPTRFGSIFRPEISNNGVLALRALLPTAARIYNDYGWAGPLVLDGSRAWRVAVDGRLYFFREPAEWQAIEDARTGRISLDELEQIHRPDAFFLYPGHDQALIDRLLNCPRWRVCYSGPTCVAFVRARRENGLPIQPRQQDALTTPRENTDVRAPKDHGPAAARSAGDPDCRARHRLDRHVDRHFANPRRPARVGLLEGRADLSDRTRDRLRHSGLPFICGLDRAQRAHSQSQGHGKRPVVDRSRPFTLHRPPGRSGPGRRNLCGLDRLVPSVHGRSCRGSRGQ